MSKEVKSLPMVALRGMTVLPEMVTHFDVSRERSIQAIEEAVGYPAEKIFLPMQPGDVYQTNADTTALQNELGFKPDKSIKEGVKETIEWYRSFYQL